mgnify:CR=1 FL=1
MEVACVREKKALQHEHLALLTAKGAPYFSYMTWLDSYCALSEIGLFKIRGDGTECGPVSRRSGFNMGITFNATSDSTAIMYLWNNSTQCHGKPYGYGLFKTTMGGCQGFYTGLSLPGIVYMTIAPLI